MDGDLLERLRVHLALPRGHGRLLPREVYTDPDVHLVERERIFATAWQCVARDAEIARPGEHVVRAIASPQGGRELSVVVVRDEQGRIRVFRNVCPHRGAELVACAGTLDRFTCPYHAWSFRLDGTCIGSPHMRGALEIDGEPFDLRRHPLDELPCAIWQGFVYTTNAPVERADPHPATVLGALDDVLGRYRIDRYEPVADGVDIWATNWKCLLENFLDAYHVFKVHRSTFASESDSTASTTIHRGGAAHTHHVAVDAPDSSYGVADPDNTTLEGTWRHSTVLAAVYPTHVMQVQPDWMWHLALVPVSVGEVRIHWSLSVAPERLDAEADPEAYVLHTRRLLDAVNAEDRPVVEGLWRALHHRDAPRGPMSRLEGNVDDIHRYIAGRLIGR